MHVCEDVMFCVDQDVGATVGRGEGGVLQRGAIGSPVTVVWPRAAFVWAPCRTTSGLRSTDAPLSSTAACSEEGTRTHTAPTYEGLIREQHKRGRSFSCCFTLSSVHFRAGSVPDVGVDASAV